MLDTKNTRKIISLLRDRGDNRRITCQSLDNLVGYRGKVLGAVIEKASVIEVYLDTTYPELVQENSFVCELLYVLCSSEGYPNIQVNPNKFRGLARKQPELVYGLRDDF